MKLVCEGINLSEAVLKVVKACANKTTVPVMECIKLSARNDSLTLTATDGEISITKTIKLTKDYASNGWLASNPKTEVLEVDGLTHNSNVVYDLQQQDVIKQRLLSPSMQPYSLLQGEAIDNIVDLSNSNNLASTVEALTDIAELKVIEKSCETLYKNADKDLANKQKACAQSKSDFENVQKEKDEILQQIENANESITTYKEQLKKASDEASKHEASLANTEKRVEYREKLNFLRNELSAKEAALNDLLLSINDNLFKKPLPWILYGTEGFVDKFLSKRTEYTEDMVAKNMAKNPQLLASILPEGSPDDASLTKMLKECRCFVCNRTFEEGDEHYKHVEMLRNRSLQKPTSSTAKFQSFFDGIQKSVAQFMKVDSILGAMAGTIQATKQLEDTIKALKGQIQDTLTEYKNYGGVDKGNGSQGDKNILSSYNQAKDDIQKYTQLLDSANKHVEKLRDRLQGCDKKLSEYAGTAVPQACQDLKEIIEDELNVKEMTFTDDVRAFTSYTFKPQLKTVGPKYGKFLGGIKKALSELDGNQAMDELKANGQLKLDINGQEIVLLDSDLLIDTAQTEGYVSESDNDITVVLDTNLTPELIEEGFVREIISKIQTMRKEAGFEVTDKIGISLGDNQVIENIFRSREDQIKSEVLAEDVVYGKVSGYEKDWKINSENVKLGVWKLS